MRIRVLGMIGFLAWSACQAPPDPAPDPLLRSDLGLSVDAWPPWMSDGNKLPLDGDEPRGQLWLRVTDSETGQLIPARVIFRPPPAAGFADSIFAGSPDPNSPGSATGATVGPGVVGSPEGVLLQVGQGAVPVPPGTYQLFVTRGPEYEAVETTVSVGAGEVQVVDAALDRSVDTRGWLAADLHVHTLGSFDAQLPLDRRVISMVSSGVEVIVPTDHHVVTDLGPVIALLGYGPEVVGQVIGDELNFKEGHAGVYPVPYDQGRAYGGSLPYQAFNAQGQCDPPLLGSNCYSAAEAFPIMRAIVPGTTVVTVNHPWWGGGDLGYFTNVGWGAGTAGGFGVALPAAGRFDALEVSNGYWARDDAHAYLLADWFELLRAGHRVTALASSDTHKINWVRAGFPRTWLRLPNDRPGETTGALLSEAIRHQRAVASTGPFATLTVDGAAIGDTVVPKIAGRVTVALHVDAPGWMKVDTVRLYVGGYLRETIAVEPGRRPVLEAQLTERVGTDTWIVVLASGQQPLAADVVGEYSEVGGWQMKPWALTNPVFVDADGDGSWTPVEPLEPLPAPLPMPASAGPLPAGERIGRPGVVPVDCDPRAPGGGEPPLDALSEPARILMPLLNL